MDNTFGLPIIPANEQDRLAKLRSYDILDTYQEEGPFKHIAAMASRMFNVPIALINLVEKDYVVTRQAVGMEPGTQVPRGTSLCSLAILRDHSTVFENALEEPCLLSNPLVTGDFNLRFYAAAPLTTADGYNIGALCLVDKEPRTFTEVDQKILENLASVVMDEIQRGNQS
ncbi:GAF domain-containing protein [Rufibacter sp. LB8]|nr:GAF domain-containing protein [Rufibacter sp. LB8]